MTALGQVQPKQAIFRHTAVPGMTVVITGCHGLSRAGLAVLLKSEPSIYHPNYLRWIQAHQYPVPQFDAIALLQSIHPYPTITGMDSSDGLANALLQISQRSGVGIEIELSRLSISADLVAFAGTQKALEWTLFGGEDFELVLCLPPENASHFLTLCKGAIAIGTTTNSGVVQLRSLDSSTQDVQHQSFQHFS